MSFRQLEHPSRLDAAYDRQYRCLRAISTGVVTPHLLERQPRDAVTRAEERRGQRLVLAVQVFERRRFEMHAQATRTGCRAVELIALRASALARLRLRHPVSAGYPGDEPIRRHATGGAMAVQDGQSTPARSDGGDR
jgi:hypothetical protein